MSLSKEERRELLFDLYAPQRVAKAEQEGHPVTEEDKRLASEAYWNAVRRIDEESGIPIEDYGIDHQMTREEYEAAKGKTPVSKPENEEMEVIFSFSDDRW